MGGDRRSDCSGNRKCGKNGNSRIRRESYVVEDPAFRDISFLNVALGERKQGNSQAEYPRARPWSRSRLTRIKDGKQLDIVISALNHVSGNRFFSSS